MAISELFDALPGKLNAEAAAGLTKTLQWNITGDEPGVWAFQITDGIGQLIPGGVEAPDVTFTSSSRDWSAISEGKLDATRAFMTGKLKVTGDKVLAMKMYQLFPLETK
jgi:putative sterol carrier protein